MQPTSYNHGIAILLWQLISVRQIIILAGGMIVIHMHLKGKMNQFLAKTLESNVYGSHIAGREIDTSTI